MSRARSECLESECIMGILREHCIAGQFALYMKRVLVPHRIAALACFLDQKSCEYIVIINVSVRW